MLKTKVKVGNVSNLSDARYCAGMGVDMLGFDITPGSASIDPKRYREITEWVAIPQFVLEWNAVTTTGLNDAISEYNADLLEIHVSLVEYITNDIPLIVRVRASDWYLWNDFVRQMRHKIAYVLLQGEDLQPDSGRTQEIAAELPVLVGYGLSRASLPGLLEIPIAGLALTASPESRPGLQDYTALAEVLELLDEG